MHVSEKTTARARVARAGVLAIAVATLALTACAKKEGASQVAAKVNDGEITVHQLNFLLQQQRNVHSAEEAEAAKRQLLERLIDQQLAVQGAEKNKLDRDPQTMQMIEAARREILARRYMDSVVEKSAQPSDEDIRKYYDAHPALFSQRKVYSLTRLDIPVPPDKRDEIVSRVAAARSAAEITDWLSAQDIKFTSTPINQPAEVLPLQIVDKVAELKEGQSLSLPQQMGVAVLTLVSAQTQPKSLEESRTAIGQFLTVDARRNALQAATRDLRNGAKIEYVGAFAASAPGAGDAPPAASEPSGAASGTDAATLPKGLGLK